MPNLDKTTKNSGFTLLEAMIVLAIIAVLATLAYPAYMDAVRKGRRADAGDAMLYVQQLQEKWRASNTSYNATFGGANGIGYSTANGDGDATSAEGYYILTLGNTSATSFTLVAAGQLSQASDTSNPIDCSTLTLTVTAANPRGVKTPAQCWAN